MQYHAQTISNLRAAMSGTGNVCAIMLDTKGPEVRSGKLEGGQDVKVVAGTTFTLKHFPDDPTGAMAPTTKNAFASLLACLFCCWQPLACL